MSARKNVFVIVGSAAKNSSNLQLINHIAAAGQDRFRFTLCDALQAFPHFDPLLSLENTPKIIQGLRSKIAAADAVLICTPEYIFSIPGGLKNVLEWCVATTIFSNKPVGLITASAHGVRGHEELKLIMKTVEARFTDETTLLIQGIKGKVDGEGRLKDGPTREAVSTFLAAFDKLLSNGDSQ